MRAVTRAGCELQSSGLPPVQVPHLACPGKTMWPLAGASFPATAETIRPHQLPLTDTALPLIPTVNP